jgi:dTDP-4-amino-4,6-dideoxygalactose transaminase
VVVSDAPPRAPAALTADASAPAVRGLRRQPPVLSPLSLRALARAAASGLVRGGSARSELASLLRQEYRADGALLTDSGTSALQIAIRLALAGDDTGGMVALPAYGCYDIATAAVGTGASIVLYDVDPATLAPDASSFAAALDAGARAAVVAPLYGVPCDWESLEALALPRGTLLIEDAAQGHGAAWRGRPLGSLGRLSVLSFGRGKGWTGGCGGALLWRGGDSRLLPALPHGAAGLRVLAAASAQWLFGRPLLYAIPSAVPGLGLGETVYRQPRAPAAIPAVAAALLLATRDAALHHAEVRRRVGGEFCARFGDGPAAIRIQPAATPGWLRFPVRLPGGAAADAATRLRGLGVARGYPTTLAELPAVRSRLVRVPADSADGLPGAATLARDLITLPTHTGLRPAERARLMAALAAELAGADAWTAALARQSGG